MKMEPLISMLKDMVQIDSTQYREAELGEYLTRILEENGYTVTRQEVNTETPKEFPSRFNIVATKKDPTLIFMGHLDTVQYSTRDMLTLKEEGGSLFGRGAVDMKGGIAAFMQALLDEERNDHVGVIFTVDEEYELKGVNNLVKLPEFKLLHPHLLVIAEPTNLKIINEHRGCYEIHVYVRGKSAHASTTSEGISSIKVINACERLEKLLEHQFFRDVPSMFDMPSMNVGYLQVGRMISAEDKSDSMYAIDENSVNSVPDLALVKIDIRPTPQLHSKGIDYVIRKFEQEVKKERLTIAETRKPLNYGPVSIDREKYKKVEDVLHSLSIPVEYSEMPGFTEMGVVYNALKCPCMNFGPGPESASHKDGEYVDTASLEKTYHVYTELIRTYKDEQHE